MRLPERTVAVALLALFALMVVTAGGYPAAARLVPLTVGVPALLLAAWQLWREWRGAASAQGPSRDGRTRPAEAVAIAWFALFVAVIVAGGFVIGGVVAVVAAQRFWLKESWRATAAGAAAAFAVLQLGIVSAMGMPLFEGLVTRWVERWLRV